MIDHTKSYISSIQSRYFIINLTTSFAYERRHICKSEGKNWEASSSWKSSRFERHFACKCEQIFPTNFFFWQVLLYAFVNYLASPLYFFVCPEEIACICPSAEGNIIVGSSTGRISIYKMYGEIEYSWQSEGKIIIIYFYSLIIKIFLVKQLKLPMVTSSQPVFKKLLDIDLMENQFGNKAYTICTFYSELQTFTY